MDTCERASKNLQQQKDDLTERLRASEQKIQALDTQLAAVNDEKKQLHHKLEECSTQLEQHQQNTTLVHRELQEKIQQSSTQLQDAINDHKKTTATLGQQITESDEKLRTAKDELSKKLTTTEQRMQRAPSIRQATLVVGGVCVFVLVCTWLMQTTLNSLLDFEQRLNQHQKTLEKVTYIGTLPFEFTMTEFEQHKWAGTVTAHKETTAAQHILDQHKRESNEKLKAAKDELSKKLAASEHAMQIALNTQQAALTQQKNELTEKLSASEQKLQATLASQQTTITKCRDENRRLQQSLTEQERKQLESEAKLMRVKNTLTRKITASEQKMQTQEATLNQHQKTLEKVTCTGTLPFEFTMTEFEKHKRASDQWYSPPFYTHTHGYRMCVEVWANAHGPGKGTHVSIFTCIMRGPFDADLKWPFRGDVTVQIVNQVGEDNHQERVIHYTDRTPDSSAGRVTDKERSDGWGFHEFLPHSSLGNNAASNTQYLRGDSLRIRISKVELKN